MASPATLASSPLEKKRSPNNKAWWIAFAIVLLATLTFAIFLNNSRNELDDSDTVLILTGIRERHNPMSWFTGDWPLFNHFYRPVVSLIFELDNFLHPHSTVGFATTDILLCMLSTLGLFWFLREFFDKPLLATLGTLLFVVWQWDLGGLIARICPYLAAVALLAGLWRHSLRIAYYLPAVLVWWWLMIEYDGITSLSFRMLAWIPGRTASTMTVFAFISMAAFARYLRLSPMRDASPKPATALDRPATKSSVVTVNQKPSIGWPILSVVSLIICLGAYEQAVMVPALLGLTALYFYLLGRKVEWGWGWAFGVCLGIYLILRQSVISHEPSAYWNWQKRSIRTSLTMMQRYLFMPYSWFTAVWQILPDGPVLWLTSSPWLSLFGGMSGLSALWESRRRWLICGFGWLGSTLAYGPMAFFKDFDHYHYWPMAIRTIFVLGLTGVAIDLMVIALSRPAQQAPQRLSPAPGSLLHR